MIQGVDPSPLSQPEPLFRAYIIIHILHWDADTVWNVVEALLEVYDLGLSDVIVIDEACLSTVDFFSGVHHDASKLNIRARSALLSARASFFLGLIIRKLLPFILGTRW